MTEWPSDQMTEWPNDWVTKWPSDWMTERKNYCVTEWLRDWVTERTSDQVTEQPSDWVTKSLTSDQVTKWQDDWKLCRRLTVWYIIIFHFNFSNMASINVLLNSLLYSYCFIWMNHKIKYQISQWRMNVYFYSKLGVLHVTN